MASAMPTTRSTSAGWSAAPGAIRSTWGWTWPNTAGWTAPAQIDTSHDWNVQLATQDGLWRIRGRLQKDTRAVRLAPAHGGG